MMSWGFSCRGAVLRRAWRAVCAPLAGVAALALGAPAEAGEVATVSATARATIVAPLTLVTVQNMDFGRIVPRPQAGTVTIDQNTGACSVTGPILEVGKCAYAQFAGMGTKNMTARITLSNVVNLTGPGQTMVLDNIILGTNSTITLIGNTNAKGGGAGLTQGSGNQRYSITTSSGIFLLNIGGRLNVNANQAPGSYAGSITVTVQYQ